MNLRQDLRYAVRMLLKAPGFAAVAILTLALGIGANTAVFSVFKAVILEPFPYPDSSRLVQVWVTDIARRTRAPFSSPNYFEVKEQSTSFEELGAYTTRMYNVSDREPVPVQGVAGTAGVLRACGVRPVLGRLFTEAEEREGSHRVVVLGNGLWKRLYGADPRVLGRMIKVNGEDHEVVGVMPGSFEFHSPWYRGQAFELWTPLVLSRDEAERGRQWLLALGRLKPGVGWRAAEAEVRSIAARLSREYPATNSRAQMWLQPLALEIVGGASGRLAILLGTVGLVLLMACANVAGMLLAKGAGRQTEVAIRVSLGASRKRVAAQFLTESLLLSLAGGAAGLLFALWSLDSVLHLVPRTLPRSGAIRIDGWVLLFSLAISVVTALLAGLTPARAALKTDVVDALKEGSGSHAGARARSRMLRRLAVVQLALALLLTNGAVFLFKSYQNLLNTDLVFDTDEVLTVEMWLSGPRYEEEERRVEFWEQLRERVAGFPGVEHVAVTTKLPLEGGTNGEILVDGQAFDPQVARPLTEWSFVSPEYFDAMGIPLLSGRTLEKGDDSRGAYGVVVNRALAERCWPGENAIGRRIRSNSSTPRFSAVVVGVVESVRQWGSEQRPLPEIYFPYSVNPRVRSRLAVHSRIDPTGLVPAIREEVSRLDSDVPLSDVRTMADVFSASTRHRRFLTLLLDLFAAIALVLAVAGIYGNMSYNVAQRTHEIGVRVALGAARGNLLAMIFRRALWLLSIGVAIGLAATIGAAFVFRNLVYGISPLNPLYLSGGILLVAAAALLATLVPALRAARLDPVKALRTE